MNTINPAQGNPQVYQGTMPQTQSAHAQEKTQQQAQAQASKPPQQAAAAPQQANNPASETHETHEADHDQDNTVGNHLNTFA